MLISILVETYAKVHGFPSFGGKNSPPRKNKKQTASERNITSGIKAACNGSIIGFEFNVFWAIIV